MPRFDKRKDAICYIRCYIMKRCAYISCLQRKKERSIEDMLLLTHDDAIYRSAILIRCQCLSRHYAMITGMMLPTLLTLLSTPTSLWGYATPATFLFCCQDTIFSLSYRSCRYARYDDAILPPRFDAALLIRLHAISRCFHTFRYDMMPATCFDAYTITPPLLLALFYVYAATLVVVFSMSRYAAAYACYALA